MRKFKSDDLLVAVFPVKQAEKGAPCPGCTNFTPTIERASRVSKEDLAALQRVLAALQKSALRKKR